MKVIARGAEAIIYENDGEIIKYREKKDYRIPEIDVPMRKARTKIEFNILKKCAEGRLNAPKPIKTSKEGDKIYMSKIEGIQFDRGFSLKYLSSIGVTLAKLHKLGVIHGDLTTANMILSGETVFLIDFGLSYFSKRAEDRATDLFLFRNALKSRHPKEFLEAYNLFLSSYKDTIGKEFKGIDTHLKDIERRGRYHENS